MPWEQPLQQILALSARSWDFGQEGRCGKIVPLIAGNDRSLSISNEDFIGRGSLSFFDMDFVNGKPAPPRLGWARMFRPSACVECDAVNQYDFSGRTARRHYAEILQCLRQNGPIGKS
ncbi:hypothetical protein [Mesorhizobium loti]|uniref:hypothetical protein n=1 Tax=Rhizobium loti TaxID=381 RepID=UPI0007EF1D05|nr:hypothetical protein [Mesorhizobium loti]OBP96874.1 hypothetical protein BAE38_26615 [Mesorhizobium loti]